MAQVTVYPLPCRKPSPRRSAPRTLAISRATEGFSATIAVMRAEVASGGVIGGRTIVASGRADGSRSV